VTVAMVCTNSGQTADLEVATLAGSRTRPVASGCCDCPSATVAVVVRRAEQPSLYECVRPGWKFVSGNRQPRVGAPRALRPAGSTDSSGSTSDATSGAAAWFEPLVDQAGRLGQVVHGFAPSDRGGGEVLLEPHCAIWLEVALVPPPSARPDPMK